jgi:hypothetical protein
MPITHHSQNKNPLKLNYINNDNEADQDENPYNEISHPQTTRNPAPKRDLEE